MLKVGFKGMERNKILKAEQYIAVTYNKPATSAIHVIGEASTNQKPKRQFLIQFYSKLLLTELNSPNVDINSRKYYSRTQYNVKHFTYNSYIVCRPA